MTPDLKRCEVRTSCILLEVYAVPGMLGAAAVVAGLAVVLTIGSLLGYLLIIGGVAAVGWTMVPAVVSFFVRWLSMGR